MADDLLIPTEEWERLIRQRDILLRGIIRLASGEAIGGVAIDMAHTSDAAIRAELAARGRYAVSVKTEACLPVNSQPRQPPFNGETP